ncbi:PP2C family protein-serine/threonine phosphatase [Streptomyces roseolus]|uniref:PP2C family protein-serine/threonine phosphatase n=1 Tax=Streptomyces roseolus TaxID=67358 RepID=UPI001E2A3ED1|nr:PP2C family protein-serine/threonine phosphatase [Streptomyces roseolus]
MDRQALRELLAAQRDRIGAYARARSSTPRPPADPAAAPPVPDPVPAPVQELLDAFPAAALLVQPVVDADGRITDFLYLTQNTRAVAYSRAHVPTASVPRWSGPVRLFDRFPLLEDTGLPRMLADAHHERAPQGPEIVEWFIPRAEGPLARLSNDVVVAPCGDHLLVTWEPGHRVRMAVAAQKLVRTCWAEWNVADGTVAPSLGFGHVLGLAPGTPAPADLLGLADLVVPDSLPELYRLLYDIFLRKRRSECALRLKGAYEHVIRVVAEPARPRGGPVWAVRAVLVDITDDTRRRALAEAAGAEARRQRVRAEAVGEVAEGLREAVLPRSPGGLASYGIDTAVVYRPDSTRSGVGGDWYKARGLPAGRLLLALGDARGHGLDAVTLMAKLRYALAGLAYTDAPVEQLTHWLNDLACDDGIESTATAIIARYHPERRVLRWTCAGHPLPVLLRDGRATTLPAPPGGPGLTLGVLSDQPYAASETPLAEDDIVLLYSDGLTERRDSDPDRDTARLLDAAGDLLRARSPLRDHAGLQEYADALVARLDGPHRSDDVTLLALRRTTP